jgi:hypothetical protein
MKSFNRIWMAAVLGTTLTAVSLNAATINQRRVWQQERITGGVANGRLTAGETARLENREAFLNHEIRTDKALNGGHLSPAERVQVQRQQNWISGSIYVDKHNGWVR